MTLVDLSPILHSLFLQKKNQIVQEYERAVIFRLGRLLPGGAKGPGTDNNNDITKMFIVFCISPASLMSLQEQFSYILPSHCKTAKL